MGNVVARMTIRLICRKASCNGYDEQCKNLLMNNAVLYGQQEIGSYLFTAGNRKTTLKNFSRIRSKAVSVTAGLGSPTSLLETNRFVCSFSSTIPLVATLFFFRNAAEKPEAHTLSKGKNEMNKDCLMYIQAKEKSRSK